MISAHWRGDYSITFTLGFFHIAYDDQWDTWASIGCMQEEGELAWALDGFQPFYAFLSWFLQNMEGRAGVSHILLSQAPQVLKLTKLIRFCDAVLLSPAIDVPKCNGTPAIAICQTIPHPLLVMSSALIMAEYIHHQSRHRFPSHMCLHHLPDTSTKP